MESINWHQNLHKQLTSSSFRTYSMNLMIRTIRSKSVSICFDGQSTQELDASSMLVIPLENRPAMQAVSSKASLALGWPLKLPIRVDRCTSIDIQCEPLKTVNTLPHHFPGNPLWISQFYWWSSQANRVDLSIYTFPDSHRYAILQDLQYRAVEQLAWMADDHTGATSSVVGNGALGERWCNFGA